MRFRALSRALPVFFLVIALGACSALSSVVTGLAGSALTPAQLASVQQICAAVAPDLTTAASPTVAAQVSTIASYAATFCGQIGTGNISNANANSPAWLTTVLSE